VNKDVCISGLQAAASNVSGGKRPGTVHQPQVESTCLPHIIMVSSVRRVSLHIRLRDVMTADERRATKCITREVYL